MLDNSGHSRQFPPPSRRRRVTAGPEREASRPQTDMFIHRGLCRLGQLPDPNPNDGPACWRSEACVSRLRLRFSIHTPNLRRKGNTAVRGDPACQRNHYNSLVGAHNIGNSGLKLKQMLSTRGCHSFFFSTNHPKRNI